MGGKARTLNRPLLNSARPWVPHISILRCGKARPSPTLTSRSHPHNNRESGCHPERSGPPATGLRRWGGGVEGICPKDSAKSFRFDSTGTVESLWSWVAQRAMYDCGCLWRCSHSQESQFLDGRSFTGNVVTAQPSRRGARTCPHSCHPEAQPKDLRLLFALFAFPRIAVSGWPMIRPESRDLWVPHPRDVFVFVARMVSHDPQPPSTPHGPGCPTSRF